MIHWVNITAHKGQSLFTQLLIWKEQFVLVIRRYKLKMIDFLYTVFIIFLFRLSFCRLYFYTSEKIIAVLCCIFYALFFRAREINCIISGREQDGGSNINTQADCEEKHLRAWYAGWLKDRGYRLRAYVSLKMRDLWDKIDKYSYASISLDSNYGPWDLTQPQATEIRELRCCQS